MCLLVIFMHDSILYKGQSEIEVAKWRAPNRNFNTISASCEGALILQAITPLHETWIWSRETKEPVHTCGCVTVYSVCI